MNEEVRVKSLKELWALSCEKGIIRMPSGCVFVEDMKKFCGKIVTIATKNESGIYKNRYKVKEDKDNWSWSDEMLERLPKKSFIKQAIFHLKKVIVSDKEYYSLMEWENVQKLDDLPKEYLIRRPCFSRNSAGKPHVTLITKHTTVYLVIGRRYTKSTMEKIIIPALKEAGKRLSLILKKKKWSGKVEVKI
ncbi:MAG: hypothetical protein KAU20_05705 [Nanoarchaeota archaeon]|nr:hypothetical protein [Nanoarchaeota archaeon]